MIVFRYTKKEGAEYIPHLDMLKHLQKILRRGKIPMGYSKGFNPHMHIFMSSPIAVICFKKHTRLTSLKDKLFLVF